MMMMTMITKTIMMVMIKMKKRRKRRKSITVTVDNKRETNFVLQEDNLLCPTDLRVRGNEIRWTQKTQQLRSAIRFKLQSSCISLIIAAVVKCREFCFGSISD
jgi:hypothetical protein